jgi:hypothetical protein
MTKTEIDNLKHGVYRIYWEGSANYTVGAIGSLPNGNRWLQSANWVSSIVIGFGHPLWDQVEKVELIEEMNYNQEPVEEEKHTAPLRPYRIQIKDQQLAISKRPSIVITEWSVRMSLPQLLAALKECGYQITEPPSKAFTELKEFLDTHDCFAQVDSIGDSIFVYIHNIEERKVSISRTDSRAQVSVFIRNTNDPVFVGHVESLDEFKLIWNRII